MAVKSVVIVPLYIFPLTAVTWKPLHEAISSRGDLHFLIILNPDSGPGKAPWWPNKDYVREIPKLTAHDNVTTVGYVPIDYCNRDLGEVEKDVDSYASWKADFNIPGCYVDGIFFDETPNEHSSISARYLESITQYVKEIPDLGHRTVIHNPGCMPDYQLKNISPRPDITVVWEESHARFVKDGPEINHHNRDESCVMLHSVQIDRVSSITKMLQHSAKYIFVTNRREGFYEQFGESWERFIGAMKSQ